MAYEQESDVAATSNLWPRPPHTAFGKHCIHTSTFSPWMTMCGNTGKSPSPALAVISCCADYSCNFLSYCLSKHNVLTTSTEVASNASTIPSVQEMYNTTMYASTVPSVQEMDITTMSDSQELRFSTEVAASNASTVPSVQEMYNTTMYASTVSSVQEMYNTTEF
ncbi:uncharacterized protein LOC143030413 [Oratosquilla oratoria]|uniref:uncharacterized protein LOC143030413 n=1 Tax=Oratosquilla oratoria TaxID=337810 RepID=UPI003F767FAD